MITEELLSVVAVASDGSVRTISITTWLMFHALLHVDKISSPTSTRHSQENPVISPQLHRPAMPQVIYTLDNAINSFFSEAGASSSRMQCDEVARQRCGGEIRPVSVQGLTSYTVIAGPSRNKIVQFREQTALLDMDKLALAKNIHIDVVAKCSDLGWVGNLNGSQLAIYEMDRLPGENYITARPSLTHDQRLNTVYSLARFVETAFLPLS